MAEIIRQLVTLKANGNKVANQGRRGADDITHGSTPVIQNPDQAALQVKNLQLVEVDDKVVSNHILAPAFHSIELLGVDTVSALRVVIALLAPPFHSKELLRVDAVNALRMATALPMPTFLSRELLVQIAIGA
ncbi:hypothetical protein LWI29_009374 [Acer saccharum]|uniref:Uncharacterized protein n=1 Tax=Acer saccharum TaxID=4024 RepID=A0AA39RHA9_ACESA|nr:hypothetical protein LWI29_009374 [Acer saccharum]